MAKNENWTAEEEVPEIIQKFLDKFPTVFEDFRIESIKFIRTLEKKSKEILKVRPVRYPQDVFVDAPYIMEVFDMGWEKLDQKRKNLLVFHHMCSFPEGAFDPTSEFYAKKVKPQIVMYELEHAVTEGVWNWRENDLVNDPMEFHQDIAKKIEDEIDGVVDPLPVDPSPRKMPATVNDVALV